MAGKEKEVPREKLYMAINDLMIKADFVPEDILTIIGLLVSKAEVNNKMFRPTHCGACERGVFIPVLQGYVHPEEQMFDNNKLQFVTMTICSHCGYIHKERIQRRYL